MPLLLVPRVCTRSNAALLFCSRFMVDLAAAMVIFLTKLHNTVVCVDIDLPYM